MSRPILFISDLHLDPSRPAITELFLRFLHEQRDQAEALYILGDLFEAWIGDDAVGPDEPVIAALQAFSAQVPTYFMHGNRDFLIGERFAELTGIALLADPTVIDLHGVPTLLMHGDSLCTRDEGYMRMRRLLRNPLSLFILHSLSLAKRQRIASKLRSTSKEETRMKASDIVDVTPDEVIKVMRRHKVRTLIHGHTHRPAVHSLHIDGQPAQRIVLGDWDHQGWALQVDESGLQQAPFGLD